MTVWLAALLAAGCVGPIQTSGIAQTSADDVSVYLVNRGWHTDLVVPKAAVPNRLWPEKEDFPDAGFLAIGWGDWEFYQAPDNTTLWMTTKAVAWPTDSVLHVAEMTGPIDDHTRFHDTVEIVLPRDAFERLCRYVHNSFSRSGDRVQPIRSIPDSRNRFYPAQGRFHLFRTCNAWTASALRAAGIPIDPVSALFAGTLMSEARRHSAPLQ